jgi:hypothetical protein
MNNPDEAHRLTQERIAKLEKDKEQAERVAEESRKNEEDAKRLVERERARTEQLMKNAAEERRRRLVLKAELREVRELLNAWGNT